MFNSRRIIPAVIVGLIVTATANADMVPVLKQGTERTHSVSAYDQTEIHYSNLSNPSNFFNASDLDPRIVKLLPQTNTDVEQTSEVQHLQSFTNGPGSFNLCLSALIGFGLCGTAHFVKKLSFSFFPEWYHNGGPFQIGHSYALSPDSLCPVQVYCFIQPVYIAEDSIIEHRWRTVVSLWRKSQCTPAISASRAPPVIS
jgi:hypothetical protein